MNLEYFKENFCGYRKDGLPISLMTRNFLESCVKCNGTGRTSANELIDLHKREYDIRHEDCSDCKGEGRLIVAEVSLSFGDIPYNPHIVSSAFRNILIEKTAKPYNKEEAKDIETQITRKEFFVKAEDIKER